eukprot:g18647.t1
MEPHREAEFVNLRGYPVRELPRRRRGANRRLAHAEGSIIEKCEHGLAVWIRNAAGPLNTDDIYETMIDRLRNAGATQYYILKHATGSAEASAWVSRFLSRWGLRRVRTQAKFRSRRNGHGIVDEIQFGWQVFCDLLERIEEVVVGDPDAVTYTLMAYDETNFRRTAPKYAIVDEAVVGLNC